MAATNADLKADLRLRREYGISLKEYETILAFQNGCCAICPRPVKTMRTRLAVDHNHVTGLLRGLLCWNCNKGVLGRARDSLTILKAAVRYLEYPPATAALGRPVFTAPGKVGTKKRARLLRDMASNPTQENDGVQKPQTAKRSTARSK